MDLRVQSAHGTAAVQEVSVEVGPPEDSGYFPLSWVPTGHAKLLPTFHGVLRLVPDGDESCLSISGGYRPPLGSVGAFGDGLIGHRLAVRVLDTLLATLATRLGEEAPRNTGQIEPPPQPAPLDRQMTEIWWG